eukprot:m.181233 g.181233  ORF g.181233 m.181233 type:complete len:5196 (-) comp14961_c0_seq1:165-15752(-)
MPQRKTGLAERAMSILMVAAAVAELSQAATMHMGSSPTTVNFCSVLRRLGNEAGSVAPDGLSGGLINMSWLGTVCNAAPTFPIRYNTTVSGTDTEQFQVTFTTPGLEAVDANVTRSLHVVNVSSDRWALSAEVRAEFDLSDGTRGLVATFGFDLGVPFGLALHALAAVSASLPVHRTRQRYPLLLHGSLGPTIPPGPSEAVWTDRDLFDGIAAVGVAGATQVPVPVTGPTTLARDVAEEAVAPALRLGPIDVVLPSGGTLRTAYINPSTTTAIEVTETATQGAVSTASGTSSGLLIERSALCTESTQCPHVWQTIASLIARADGSVPTTTNEGGLCPSPILLNGTFRAESSATVFQTDNSIAIIAASAATRAVVQCPGGYVYFDTRLASHDDEGAVLASTRLLLNDQKSRWAWIKRVPNFQHGVLQGTLQESAGGAVFGDSTTARRNFRNIDNHTRDIRATSRLGSLFRISGANLFEAKRGGLALPDTLLTAPVAAAVQAAFASINSQICSAITVGIAQDAVTSRLGPTMLQAVYQDYIATALIPTRLGYLEAISRELSQRGVDITVASSGEDFFLTLLVEDVDVSAQLADVTADRISHELNKFYDSFWDRWSRYDWGCDWGEWDCHWYRPPFYPNHTSTNSIQVAASFGAASMTQAANAVAAMPVQWNVKTVATGTFGQNDNGLWPFFNFTEAVAFTGNVAPNDVSIKSTPCSRCYNWPEEIDSDFFGWWSFWDWFWYWDWGDIEQAIQDQVFTEIDAARGHHFNFESVNGYSFVLDQPLDQIDIDTNVFGKLLAQKGKAQTLKDLGTHFDTVVASIPSPPNVQTAGRAYFLGSKYIIQFEAVTSLLVSLPGVHSSSADELGTVRLALPMLISSTMSMVVGVQSPFLPVDYMYQYNLTFAGQAASVGAAVPMLHNMMVGPSQDNTTVSVTINLTSDTVSAAVTDNIISQALISASMTPPRNLPGRGIQFVRVDLNDTVESADATPSCAAQPDTANMSCLSAPSQINQPIVKWAEANPRGIPPRYIAAQLKNIPFLAGDYLKSLSVVRVPPLASPLWQLSTQAADLATVALWMSGPSRGDDLRVTRMRKAICPSTIGVGEQQTLWVRGNLPGSLDKNCTLNPVADAIDLETLIKGINADLANCDLDLILEARLAEYEYESTRKSKNEPCGQIDLYTPTYGAIYNLTVVTLPSNASIPFAGNISLHPVPIFGTLEDAGRLTDTFFSPLGWPLGQGVWSVTNLSDTLDDDLVPPEARVAVDMNPTLWSYTGTRLLSNELIQNVNVSGNVTAGSVHLEPFPNSTGTLNMTIDTRTTLGVIFVPRLHGVSANDTIPWHAIKTVATKEAPITLPVAEDNCTFGLRLITEERVCADTSGESARLGCPNHLLNITTTSKVFTIKLTVGKRLNDTFLADVLPSIPPPWQSMISVAVIKANSNTYLNSTDQLAIQIDGVQFGPQHWRFPTLAAIVPVTNAATPQSITYLSNRSFEPPQARPVMGATSINVHGGFVAKLAGPGGIGILPVHGANISAETNFTFSAAQTVKWVSVERLYSSLLGSRMFDVFSALAAMAGSVVFPNEHLDVLERGFQGGTGMIFNVSVDEKNMTSTNDTDALVAAASYRNATFNGNFDRLMSRLAETSWVDIEKQVIDLAQIDSAITKFNETRTALPFVGHSFGLIYREYFGDGIARLMSKASEQNDILDVRMLCDVLAALFSQKVCLQPILNSITHTFEVPFRWSVGNLTVRDALQININEVYANETSKFNYTFPLMEGEDGQVPLNFTCNVSGSFMLDFSGDNDRIYIKGFSTNMSVTFDVAGNLWLWFGPVKFQALDATANLQATVRIAQPDGGVQGGPVSVVPDATSCNAGFIANLDLTSDAAYCYTHITADTTVLTSGGTSPLPTISYLCGDGGIGALCDRVLREHTLFGSILAPDRFISQYRQSFIALHSGMIFGSGGALPNGLSLPLVGNQYEMQLRQELGALHSPELQKGMAAALSHVGGLWTASTGGATESKDTAPLTPNSLRQMVVDALTDLFCKQFAPLLLDGCPKAPVLAPPNDEEHTCLGGPCVWPLHLGRRFNFSLSHLENDMLGESKLHLTATESLTAYAEWELHLDLQYDDKHGIRFDYPYPEVLLFGGQLDLNLDLQGRLLMLNGDLAAGGALTVTVVVRPPPVAGLDGFSRWLVTAVDILYDLAAGMLEGCLGLDFNDGCKEDLNAVVLSVEHDFVDLIQFVFARVAQSFYNTSTVPYPPVLPGDEYQHHPEIVNQFKSFDDDFAFFKEVLSRFHQMFVNAETAAKSHGCGLDRGAMAQDKFDKLMEELEKLEGTSVIELFLFKLLGTWEAEGAEVIYDSLKHLVDIYESIKCVIEQLMAKVQGGIIDWKVIGLHIATILQDMVPEINDFCELGSKIPIPPPPPELLVGSVNSSFEHLSFSRHPLQRAPPMKSEMRRRRELNQPQSQRELNPPKNRINAGSTSPTWALLSATAANQSCGTVIPSVSGFRLDCNLSVDFYGDVKLGIGGKKGPHFEADMNFSWAIGDVGVVSGPAVNFSGIQFCLGSLVQHFDRMLAPLHDNAMIQELDQSLGPGSWLYKDVPLAGILTGKKMTYVEFVKDVVDVYCDGDCKFDNVEEALKRFSSILGIMESVGSLAAIWKGSDGCALMTTIEHIHINSSSGAASAGSVQSWPFQIHQVPGRAVPNSSDIENSMSTMLQGVTTDAKSGVEFPFLNDIGGALVSLLLGSDSLKRTMLVYDSPVNGGFGGNGRRYMHFERVDERRARALREQGVAVTDAELLMRVTIMGGSIATHTLFGPYPLPPPVSFVQVFAEIGVMAGITDIEVVLPLKAVAESVVTEDPWHLARSVALQTNDARGNPILPLFGRVILEGGAQLSIEILAIGMGVGIATTLKIGIQSPENNGLCSIGDMIWYFNSETGSGFRMFIAELEISMMIEVFVEATIPLGFTTIHFTVLDLQQFWVLFDKIYGQHEYLTVASPSGSVNLFLGAAGQDPSGHQMNLWSLSGSPGNILVRAEATGSAHAENGNCDVHGTCVNNPLHQSHVNRALSTNAMTPPSTTRHVTLPATSVSFGGSTDSNPYSVHVSSMYAGITLLSDSACTLSVDMSSYPRCREVTISPIAVLVDTGAQISTADGPIGLISLINPKLGMAVSVAGVRNNVHMNVLPFNNVTLTGDAIGEAAYSNGAVITVNGTLDTVTVGAWDTQYTISSTSVVSSHGVDLRFADGCDVLVVSGHPHKPAQFIVPSTPSNRATSVLGGDNNDHFDVVNQSSLASPLEINGAGGVDSVQSTFTALAGRVTRAIVSSGAIILTVDDTNHTLFLKNIDLRTVNLISVAGAIADATLPIARSGEHFLINTQLQPGASVTHRMFEVENAAQVRYHVVGSGSATVAFGLAGSLVGLEGAVYVIGSRRVPGQNLTVVLDGSKDPRTLRIEIQRGLISVSDTQSNQGIFRLSIAHVTRLVVHCSDFVSVDHGYNASAFLTETEIHIHNHTTVIPPWFIPRNSVRKSEVQLQRVAGPVLIVAQVPIDIVRIGVFPIGPPSAPWNNCTLNGLYCTAHPLAGFIAPVFLVSSPAVMATNKTTTIQIDTGTSPNADPQYYRLEGSSVSLAHANGTRIVPSLLPSSAFCNTLAAVGADLCDAEVGLAAIQFGTMAASDTIAEHFSVHIKTGGSEDAVFLNGTNAQIDIDLGDGNNTVRAVNVKATFTFRGGIDTTQYTLGYPIATGTIVLGAGDHIDSVTMYADGQPVGYTRNASTGVGILTNVSPSGASIAICGINQDRIIINGPGPIPVCGACVMAVFAPAVPAAIPLPDNDLAMNLNASVLTVEPIQVGDTFTYNATSCLTYPYRIVKCEANGTHIVYASVGDAMCAITVLGKRTPNQLSQIVANPGPGAKHRMSIFRDDSAMHVFNTATGSFNRLTHTNTKSIVMQVPAFSGHVQLNQGAPVTSALVLLQPSLNSLPNSVELRGNSAHTTVSGPAHVHFGTPPDGNNPVDALNFTIQPVLIVNNHTNGTTNVSFDSGVSPETWPSAFGLVGQCVSRVNTTTGQLEVASELVTRYPVPEWWCNQLTHVGVSKAQCLQRNCTVQLLLAKESYNLYIARGAATDTVVINASTAASVEVDQRATDSQTCTWAHSHTRFVLRQPGAFTAWDAVYSDATVVEPAGPIDLVWGGVPASRINSLTVISIDGVDVSNSTDGREFLTPRSGDPHQRIAVTMPGPLDIVAVEQQTSLQSIQDEMPSTQIQGVQRQPSAIPPPSLNRTCILVNGDVQPYVCASNKDYCLQSSGNTTDIKMDCRGSSGNRIFVLDDPDSPQALYTVYLYTHPTSDIEVYVILSGSSEYLEGVVRAPLSGSVRHARFELVIDQVSRLVVQNNATNGTLELDGQFPVNALVADAAWVTLSQPDAFVGTHAYISNCYNCAVGPTLWSSPYAYILANEGTIVSIAMNTTASSNVTIDGWISTTHAGATDTIPDWLILQAARRGVNLSAVPNTGHVFLSNTTQLTLTTAAEVHVVNLGETTRMLNTSAATIVSINDVVQWTGITSVGSGWITDPEHRYTIVVPALEDVGTTNFSLTQVSIFATVQHLNITCGSVASANWTFVNPQHNTTVLPLDWTSTNCVGRVFNRLSGAAVHTVTSPVLLGLRYGGVSASSLWTASMRSLNDFNLAVNLGLDSQLASVQYEDTTTTVDGTVSRAITMREGPRSSGQLSVQVSDSWDSEALSVSVEGPVLLAGIPSFDAQNGTISVQSIPGDRYCVSPYRCTPLAWQGYAVSGPDLCLQEETERTCESGAVGILALPSGQSWSCDGTVSLTLATTTSGAPQSNGATRDHGVRFGVLAIFVIGVVVAIILSCVLHPAYMLASLWLIGPLWAAAILRAQGRLSANSGSRFIQLEAGNLITNLFGEQQCAGNEVGLQPSTPLVVVGAILYAVSFVLLVIVVRRAYATSNSKRWGAVIIGCMHHEHSRVDEPVWVSPQSTKIFRVSSTLALSGLLVVFVPLAAQTGFTGRVVSTAMMLFLLSHVGFSLATPGAEYLFIPLTVLVVSLGSTADQTLPGEHAPSLVVSVLSALGVLFGCSTLCHGQILTESWKSDSPRRREVLFAAAPLASYCALVLVALVVIEDRAVTFTMLGALTVLPFVAHIDTLRYYRRKNIYQPSMYEKIPDMSFMVLGTNAEQEPGQGSKNWWCFWRKKTDNFEFSL